MGNYWCSKCGKPGSLVQMHKGCGGWFTAYLVGIKATQLESPPEPTGAPFVSTTVPNGLTEPQIEVKPSRAPEPGTNSNQAHWANGSKPTAALCDVITMLEPLSSEQRAKVIAATSAWFEGEQ